MKLEYCLLKVFKKNANILAAKSCLNFFFFFSQYFLKTFKQKLITIHEWAHSGVNC